MYYSIHITNKLKHTIYPGILCELMGNLWVFRTLIYSIKGQFYIVSLSTFFQWCLNNHDFLTSSENVTCVTLTNFAITEMIGRTVHTLIVSCTILMHSRVTRRAVLFFSWCWKFCSTINIFTADLWFYPHVFHFSLKHHRKQKMTVWMKASFCLQVINK